MTKDQYICPSFTIISDSDARFRFRNDSSFDWDRNRNHSGIKNFLLELESGVQSKPGIGIGIKTLLESCITNF